MPEPYSVPLELVHVVHAASFGDVQQFEGIQN